MQEQRPSVLGPDQEWRDPSFALPPAPRRFPRHRVVSAVVVAGALTCVVAVGRWAESYEPLVPGLTAGVGAELRSYDAADPGFQNGGFTEADLPYRDGQTTDWTYTLRNDGRFSIDLLGVEQPSTFTAEVVEVRMTVGGRTTAPGPVTLEPDEQVLFTVTFRSVRCERDSDGARVIITGVLARQRFLGLERSYYADVPQQLSTGRDTEGSQPCPRPDVVEPDDGSKESVSPIAPPY